MEPTDLPSIDGMPYVRLLGRLHAILKPRWYLEVGTFRGRSLSRADCNFVAVDPKFRLQAPPNVSGTADMHFFQKTSDEFFASGFAKRNDISFDLAFLDGLHHFEVLLRDFMNAEQLMSRDGVIALHDCCPTTVEMTSRTMCEDMWTGDVWKTLLILMRERPDLEFLVTKAAPTGLVLIRGLDPDNQVLRERYDSLVSEFMPKALDDFEGGVAGYFRQFRLIAPRAALSKLAQEEAPEVVT